MGEFSSWCISQVLNLQRLEIRILGITATAPNAADLKAVLAIASQTCPNITSIQFVCFHDVPDDVSDILCDFVCKCSRLERIILPDIRFTQTTLHHVASLPSLRALCWSPGIFYPPVGFESNLTSIGLLSHQSSPNRDQGSLEALASFTDVLCTPVRITDFRCTLRYFPTPALMKRVLSLMGERWCHDSLQSLRFATHEHVNGHIPQLHFEALKPLLAFRSVRTVDFSGRSKKHALDIDIDDHDLRLMAGSWPLLTSLQIETVGFKITLDGFLALFKSCSKLSTLQITINFNANSYNTERSELGRYPEFRYLNISNSRIDDPKKVLALFKRMFPRISRKSLRSYRGPTMVGGWRTVWDGLPNLPVLEG